MYITLVSIVMVMDNIKPDFHCAFCTYIITLALHTKTLYIYMYINIGNTIIIHEYRMHFPYALLHSLTVNGPILGQIAV